MIVTVLDRLQVLEERECRVVALPDGRAAAIWRGLAYPLNEGQGTIDVSGNGEIPDICDFPKSKSKTPTAAYVLVPGEESAYVLIAGSVMVAEAAVAHLSRSGFEVLRNGRYFGEPTEQIYPDWYVLIATPAGFDDVTEKLAIALSQLGIQASRSLATRDQILMEELFSARSAVAFERAELAKARLELAELHDATSEIPKLRESLDLAQVEIVRLSEEISQAHKSKTRPLLPAQPIDKRTGSRVGAEVLDILAVVFPRIKLIRNSIDVIVFEFSSRKGIYRCLQALQSSNQGIPVSWKVLKGIDGWIECHVSNGQDDAGRAYARVNRVDRSWDVLVSHKSDQLRDIAWLDSQ